MVKTNAFISISDPWDLVEVYNFQIPCFFYEYTCDKLRGVWSCIVDTSIGIGLRGELHYKFRVMGRHYGNFPKKNKITPAGFSSIDMIYKKLDFIGSIILSDDFQI